MLEYRLYIDESGDHSYQHVEDLDQRYLGLTGVLIQKTAYDTVFQPLLESLKRLYFSRDIDRPAILHRDDIRSCDGVFRVLLDPNIKSQWEHSILNYFASLESYAQIFTVVIDKKQHLEKYPDEPFDPYHYNLEVLLWRVHGYLSSEGQKTIWGKIPLTDVIAESRNKNQDPRLKEVYRKLRIDGAQNKLWGKAEEYRETFPTEELWVEKKIANVAGLQIADLVATGRKLEILKKEERPLKRELTEFTKTLNRTIAPILNEYGQYLMK